MTGVKSKAAWGRSAEASDAKKYERYVDFMGRLRVPDGWKMLGYDTVQTEREIWSAGAVWRDSRTSGLDLLHYRIAYLPHTKEKGVLVKKYFVAWGKQAYRCLLNNATPEQINEYITEILEVTDDGDKSQN